ncbi:MAG: hypothetical protein IJQ23_02620 [Clostridia bacterium]|nr:hypothetical protein [Clostridia bacterium]MBQ6922083.1 hypothetical protein [Clostridia bacterium]MBR0189262.1 hypothetical protein [Clostridia bacterium]
MDTLIKFFASYGLVLTVIAIAGIIILGVLKYCNLFKKIDESKRHYIYLIISVGLSVIATVIYLAIVKQLNIEYVLTVAAAIYALNQTFYNIFKITPINALAVKILTFIIELFKKKSGNVETDPDNKND